MGENKIKQLRKEDQKRHFSSELWGGKGDCRYRGNRSLEEIRSERQKYAEGWDRIWGKTDGKDTSTAK